MFDFSSEFRVFIEIFSTAFTLVNPYLHCSLGYSWNEGKAEEKWEESPILMFSCGIQFAEVTDKKWMSRGLGEEMVLSIFPLKKNRPWKSRVCHRILHKEISIFRVFFLHCFKPFIRIFLIYMKAKQYLNPHMPITHSLIIFTHGWFCPIHTVHISPFCVILTTDYSVNASVCNSQRWELFHLKCNYSTIKKTNFWGTWVEQSVEHLPSA